MARKLSIDDMRNIASERGYECISERYYPNVRLKWRCDKGHTWEAIYSKVKSGSGCPECLRIRREERVMNNEHRSGAATKPMSSKDRMKHLEEVKAIARKRGGKCISRRYIDSKTQLRFVCSKGHKWKVTPASIMKGSWCRGCLNAKKAAAMRLTIEEMQTLASRKKGQCLSQDYLNNHNKLKWQCARGHKWMATPFRIKNGSWCPKCADKKRAIDREGRFKDLQKIATKRGGKCISRKYVN